MTVNRSQYSEENHFRVYDVEYLLGLLGKTVEEAINEGLIIPIGPVRVIRFKDSKDG